MSQQFHPGFIENFGLFYLGLFRKKNERIGFILNDTQIKKAVNYITIKGILLSGIVGVACVFPMIWVDIYYAHKVWYVHYGIVAAATLLFTLIEFYFLFIISLKCVHEVAEIVDIKANEKEYLIKGPFSILNILSRTALEVDEPEISLMGINPFQRVSKKNLLLLGVLYKLKIILTNFILKYLLLFFIGKHFLGISILYEALLVEFFWNSLVIYKVIKEARLRLFGFVLANHITDKLKIEKLTEVLSENAKIASLRAIGNTIVLTKNYHPNMVILLLDFQALYEIKEPKELDDWLLFLNGLNKLDKNEKYFVLDLLCVSAAFDGKISNLEKEFLKEAFQEYHALYFKRLTLLQNYLIQGKLNAAYLLCGLDFEPG